MRPCVLLAGAALATLLQCATVHAAARLEPFCQKSELKISPGGRFVYASSRDSIIYAETGCLVSGRADCQVFSAANSDAFPRGVYFGPGDAEAYFVSAGIGPSGAATGANTIRVLTTDDGRLGLQRPYYQLTDDLLGFIVAERPAGPFQSAEEAQGSRENKLLVDASSHLAKLAPNVRNLYGRIVGDRSIYLARSDQDYSVTYRLDGGAERLLWRNGNPFSQRRSNLEFKFDGPDALALASGGVVRISPSKPLKDETASRSRALLIEGDIASTYYGYWTAEGLVAKGMKPAVEQWLDRAARNHARDHISGLAINNRSGAALVSYGPFRGQDGRQTTRHEIFQGGRSVTIDCGGERIASHKVRRIGVGKGIFVDRYSGGDDRPTVLYLTGGPGEHLSLESSFDNDIGSLLAAGFNVDVIQYGGSDYTFALYGRLDADGPASIRRDAALIETYVAQTYGDDADVSLYAFSFGASFYRYFDDRFLSRLRGVVLAAPAGTHDVSAHETIGDPVAQVQVEALRSHVNAHLWGPGTITEANEYFGGLAACPIRVPTTIVVGEKDATVRPLRDYAVCRTSSLVSFVTHRQGHVSPLDPYYAEKLEMTKSVILSVLRGER